MHRFHIAILAIATTLLLAPGVRAQEPVARDTLAVRDSAAAEADTTRTLEEIEAELLGELGAPDTAGAAPAPYAPAGAQGAAGTLNPDISVIADFLADLSPDEATIEGGDRFQLREVELAAQGSVDPYFRYDAFLALHGEGIEVEEGYATTLGLPAGLQVKVGKYRLPFGKVNLTHRPELHTIDYPLLLLEFFGEEGLASTGIWLSAIGAPLGFFQEISVVATNGAEAHAHEGEEAAEQVQAAAAQDGEEAEGKDLIDDLADRLWVAHLKNSWDLTEAANLEVGASWGTSAEDEPERLRTTLYGLDAIWRWKPPALAKYRSAILQTEVAWRTEAGRDLTQLGAFAFGQWQLSRRVYVGARWDYVEPIEAEEPNLQAGQAIVRLFPTEFSQLRLTYERQVPEEGDAVDRLLFQMTFALGPHRPHAF